MGGSVSRAKEDSAQSFILGVLLAAGPVLQPVIGQVVERFVRRGTQPDAVLDFVGFGLVKEQRLLRSFVGGVCLTVALASRIPVVRRNASGCVKGATDPRRRGW